MNEPIKKLSRKEVTQQINNLIIELDKKSNQRIKKIEKPITDSLQELLDYLRVAIKYTIFDLEATRRENKQLRESLENKEN